MTNAETWISIQLAETAEAGPLGLDPGASIMLTIARWDDRCRRDAELLKAMMRGALVITQVDDETSKRMTLAWAEYESRGAVRLDIGRLDHDHLDE